MMVAMRMMAVMAVTRMMLDARVVEKSGTHLLLGALYTPVDEGI